MENLAGVLHAQHPRRFVPLPECFRTSGSESHQNRIPAAARQTVGVSRSEERRVGKEGRSRWAPYHLKKNKDAPAPSPGTHRRGSGAPYWSPARPIHSFFQAEDGIRDYKVTGVQTCALPI